MVGNSKRTGNVHEALWLDQVRRYIRYIYIFVLFEPILQPGEHHQFYYQSISTVNLAVNRKISTKSRPQKSSESINNSIWRKLRPNTFHQFVVQITRPLSDGVLQAWKEISLRINIEKVGWSKHSYSVKLNWEKICVFNSDIFTCSHLATLTEYTQKHMAESMYKDVLVYNLVRQFVLTLSMEYEMAQLQWVFYLEWAFFISVMFSIVLYLADLCSGEIVNDLKAYVAKPWNETPNETVYMPYMNLWLQKLLVHQNEQHEFDTSVIFCLTI